MSVEFINIIESELKSYKRYIAILSELELEIDGIQSQQMSDMPHSVTNRFNSLTENMALANKDTDGLKRSIKRVDNWLDYLNYKERYIIKSFYIEDWTFTKICREWEKLEGIYFTPRNWKTIKKISLKKISNLYIKQKTPNTADIKQL